MQFLDKLHIVLHHNFHQVGEGGLLGIPAQQGAGLGGIAQELLHLGGAEVTGIDLNKHFSGGAVNTLLVNALALPMRQPVIPYISNVGREAAAAVF